MPLRSRFGFRFRLGLRRGQLASFLPGRFRFGELRCVRLRLGLTAGFPGDNLLGLAAGIRFGALLPGLGHLHLVKHPLAGLLQGCCLLLHHHLLLHGGHGEPGGSSAACETPPAADRDAGPPSGTAAAPLHALGLSRRREEEQPQEGERDGRPDSGRRKTET